MNGLLSRARRLMLKITRWRGWWLLALCGLGLGPLMGGRLGRPTPGTAPETQGLLAIRDKTLSIYPKIEAGDVVEVAPFISRCRDMPADPPHNR
jgi:hypothetical protein